MAACGSEELRRHGVYWKGKSPVPVFVQLAESTKSYSLSRVLSKIRQYRTEQSMAVRDFEQVGRLPTSAVQHDPMQTYSGSINLFSTE
jgi:hypothetical protein